MRPTLKARDVLRAAALRLRETDPVFRALDGEEMHPNQQPTRVRPVAYPTESSAR